jgi:hypothetical protein
MKKTSKINRTSRGLGAQRALALMLSTAFAAGAVAVGLPAESQALGPPNKTDLGQFCALSADDCLDLTTGDYGDPSGCGPLAKKYATASYISAASFTTLCSQAKRWVIRG